MIALGAGAVFALYGAVLAYHWFRFSLNKGVATFSMAVYILGGGALVLTLFGAVPFL